MSMSLLLASFLTFRLRRFHMIDIVSLKLSILHYEKKERDIKAFTFV